MTFTEALRWAWTMGTGFAVLFALWNLREAFVDHWAVSQIRTRPVDILRLQTQGEVWDHALILAALGSLFAAGMFSLFSLPDGALVSLIVCAVALIVLSFSQTHRRRRVFGALRLRKKDQS